MTEGVHHPHQVMDQERVGIARIAISLKPRPVSPFQHLRTGTNWKKASLSMGKGYLTIAWGMTK